MFTGLIVERSILHKYEANLYASFIIGVSTIYSLALLGLKLSNIVIFIYAINLIGFYKFSKILFKINIDKYLLLISLPIMIAISFQMVWYWDAVVNWFFHAKVIAYANKLSIANFYQSPTVPLDQIILLGGGLLVIAVVADLLGIKLKQFEKFSKVTAYLVLPIHALAGAFIAFHLGIFDRIPDLHQSNPLLSAIFGSPAAIPEYPKMLPVLSALVSEITSVHNEALPKSSMLYLLFGVILGFSEVNYFNNKEKRFIFFILFGLMGIHSFSGYLDGWLSIYATLCCLFMINFKKGMQERDIINCICSLCFLPMSPL